MTKQRFSSFAKAYYLLPIAIYVLAFLLLFVVLLQFKLLPSAFNTPNLAKWDASYYKNIKDFGYTYTEGKACNAGFFPLFPYFWRFTHLPVIGMAVLNAIIFLGSVSVLANLYRPKVLDL